MKYVEKSFIYIEWMHSKDSNAKPIVCRCKKTIHLTKNML